MASFRTVLRFLGIGFFLAMVSGCDKEYWFNADGSGRIRWILNEKDIKAVDPKGEGFDKKSKEFREICARTKVRANMTRDVVYGKTRWIQDLDYDSIDQLARIEDKDNTQDSEMALAAKVMMYSEWQSTTEPNGDVKYKYMKKLNGVPGTQGGADVGTPRQVTAHLPGRIITSNADTIDEQHNIATWDITNHKSITPTVIVRLSLLAKNKDASKAKMPTVSPK